MRATGTYPQKLSQLNKWQRRLWATPRALPRICRVLRKQGGGLETNVHVSLLLPPHVHFISQRPVPFLLVIKPSLSKETITFQCKTAKSFCSSPDFSH